MILVVCEDCGTWLNNKTIYGYDLKNVCGRCYAIHYNHPSTRKVSNAEV